ncbi:MAG: hypothetical protein ACJAWH_000988 [Maribacter sp.]|jgi:hypothetical protein
MKNLTLIFTGMVVLASVSMVSCKDNKAETKTQPTEITKEQGTEYTPAYVCPMHCKDSGSDKEGKCDTCGMALVKIEDHKANGHKHE